MTQKGYVPKNPRPKLPLTVEEQRNLLMKANENEKALALLILSTGMHPKVLSDKGYGLTFSDNYYEWNRPKTRKVVRGNWSRAVRESGVLTLIEKMRGCTRQWYWQMLKAAGSKIKLKGLCPNQLRHTFFVNLGRLERNPYDIKMKSATDFDTAYGYYMNGKDESGVLTSSDKEFLKWLMEV